MKITVTDTAEREIDIKVPSYWIYKGLSYIDVAKFDGKKVFVITKYTDEDLFGFSAYKTMPDIIKAGFYKTDKKEYEDIRQEFINYLTPEIRA